MIYFLVVKIGSSFLTFLYLKDNNNLDNHSGFPLMSVIPKSKKKKFFLCIISSLNLGFHSYVTKNEQMAHWKQSISTVSVTYFVFCSVYWTDLQKGALCYHHTPLLYFNLNLSLSLTHTLTDMRAHTHKHTHAFSLFTFSPSLWY